MNARGWNKTMPATSMKEPLKCNGQILPVIKVPRKKSAQGINTLCAQPSTTIFLNVLKKTSIFLAFLMLMTSCGNPSQKSTEKQKEPRISELVTLKSNTAGLREVQISNDPRSWTKANEISYVPNGTPARILSIHSETIEAGDEKIRILRYEIITETDPIIEGWVHSFDAGYSTEK